MHGSDGSTSTPARPTEEKSPISCLKAELNDTSIPLQDTVTKSLHSDVPAEKEKSREARMKFVKRTDISLKSANKSATRYGCVIGSEGFIRG